ncbi:MAG: hypothetical protein HC915_15685 [Anaerolineae bacterium]|nr:hypothetical protein [Anaerolineae bacterium]
MTTEAMRQERITWLRYEFAERLERCERGELTPRQLAENATQVTSQDELDRLADELLQHTFWAMHHLVHRPACWAPSGSEIAYLRRCLRDEDLFDPSLIESRLSE